MMNKNYLPILDYQNILTAVSERNWSKIHDELGKQSYERVGIDRALQILSDMTSQKIEPGEKVVDFGCNNGLIAVLMAAHGYRTSGVESGHVDEQSAYDEINVTDYRHVIEFNHIDMLDYLRGTSKTWAVSLLLSVAHHWKTGYAMSGPPMYKTPEIDEVLDLLKKRTRRLIYVEMPRCEPGFASGEGDSLVRQYFGEMGEVAHIGATVGPQGYPRDLWRVRVGQ